MNFDLSNRKEQPPSLSSFAALVCAAALVGCADADRGPVQQPDVSSPAPAPAPPPTDDGEDAAPEPPPAAPEPSGMCGSVVEYLESFGAPSTCDETLAAACEQTTGLLSDAYVAAVDECIGEDHSPMTCVVLALGDLQPSAAHLELAERFCDECAFDVPGCEQLFYFEEDEPIGLGIVALPLSDELVLQIADECTDGLSCALDFFGCARDVIQSHVEVEAAVDCVLDAVGG